MLQLPDTVLVKDEGLKPTEAGHPLLSSIETEFSRRDRNGIF